MGSIWKDYARQRHFPARKSDGETDVLIVGGGIAGILCTYMLRQAGVDCMLIEQADICGGITGDTTAKITIGHGLIYDQMIRRFGVEHAQLYAQAQAEALEQYCRLAEKIPCDFKQQDSYVYSLDSRVKLEREVRALERIGCKADLREELALPFPTRGGVRYPNQAQFHPLKFLFGLAEGLPIYEHTKLTQWLPDGVLTNYGKISAKKIIIATHFPVFNKHGAYFLKLYQHRSYVLALENAPLPDGMYVDECDTGLSFRSYDSMLLLGGGSHRTGKQGGCWAELEAVAQRYYPDAKPVAKWATQDCMTLDRIPYIGRYANGTPDVYVATGFNKWGMTSAMTAAMILTDLVQDRPNPFAQVFAPSRSVLRPQLWVNAFESMLGLLTPTAPRCPHLGCALKYNKQEHSWDCSCHGSRFAEDGQVLNNPATGDKQMPKKRA